ncbi:MAG: hypothetical protein JSR98_22060 [Proteobacteria bacterium]|nr:hypothetical protein [Pseudomonadota bacterium]
MTSQTVRDRALAVDVVDGEIVMRDQGGPAAVALTPAAAEETARRLSEAVRTADDSALADDDQPSQDD